MVSDCVTETSEILLPELSVECSQRLGLPQNSLFGLPFLSLLLVIESPTRVGGANVSDSIVSEIPPSHDRSEELRPLPIMNDGSSTSHGTNSII